MVKFNYKVAAIAVPGRVGAAARRVGVNGGDVGPGDGEGLFENAEHRDPGIGYHNALARF